MKKILPLFVAVTFCHMISAQDIPIGKSMGRWDGFGLESMCSNKGKGLDYIEVTMNNVIGGHPETAMESAVRVMDDITASGLEVWSVHMPYSRKLDISVVDDSLRASNLEFMKDMMRVAGVFRPRYVVLHPSSEPIAPEEREQRLANSHMSIGELAPVAKEIGAVLCVENLPRTCLGQTGEEMMRLIEGYDDVGLCFDTNHLMYQSHSDYLKAVGKGRIRTVHLSDYDFENECHWVPGKGRISWPGLWQGILDNGYRGIMMFECYGEPEELEEARDMISGVRDAMPDMSDSAAFFNADWDTVALGGGAVAMSAQMEMFNSAQSISVVKYPSSEFRTEILHRPGKMSGKVSAISISQNAKFAVNGGYFHVKSRTPSVYFRIGREVLGHTHPTEVYRVDGLLAIKNRRGRKLMIEWSDTTRYEKVAGRWHTVMASGPMLMYGGEIVVPVITGDGNDGDNIKAAESEAKDSGLVRTHYTSSQFFDQRHPRAMIGLDAYDNVYYVVIDGRFAGLADGATIYEAAYICYLLGMKEALNLDGGGSSTLWTYSDGVLNHPYDNRKFDHDGERAVPNLIVAY